MVLDVVRAYPSFGEVDSLGASRTLVPPAVFAGRGWRGYSRQQASRARHVIEVCLLFQLRAAWAEVAAPRVN